MAGYTAPLRPVRSSGHGSAVGVALVLAFALGLLAGHGLPRSAAGSVAGTSRTTLAPAASAEQALRATPYRSVGDIIAANDAAWTIGRATPLHAGDIISANDAAWAANHPSR